MADKQILLSEKFQDINLAQIPSWRKDELRERVKVSQKVLDGYDRKAKEVISVQVDVV